MKRPVLCIALLLMQVLCGPQRAAGTEPPAVPPTVVERGERVIAGPAMGTTYRITLASPVPGMSRGEVHREMEAVLARIDAAASNWRPDSDVSLFNRSPAGEWVPISTDLATLVEIARIAHDETNGCFDITVGPLLDLWSNAEQSGTKPPQAAIDAAMAKVGMAALELRHTPSGTRELRKTRTGLTLTLSGIGPGYAVDRLGERLSQLGSAGHLVVLGGEARAWGTRADGRPWELSIMRLPNDSADGVSSSLTLAEGEAVAFSTIHPGRSPIDPRTGKPVDHAMATVMARGQTCAIADALAVAAAISMPERTTH